MTLEEARALLDRARDGDPTLTARQITDALRLTGDVVDEHADRQVVIRRAAGTWRIPSNGGALRPADWCDVLTSAP